MSALTVGVVITFYRDDAWFPEALASVLAQDHPADRIVVVDDASPPGTASTLAMLPPEVQVIRHEENRGAGAARNTGTRAIGCDLVAYLDADDAWLPSKLRKQLAAFTADPGLAGHHVGLTAFRADQSEHHYVGKPVLIMLPDELRRNQSLPSALMLRSEALERVGGWSEDRGVMEDWDLGIRLVAAGGQIRFLPESLVRFRRTNHGNISAQGFGTMFRLLGTIRRHRALYHSTLGRRGTLAVTGRVLHDEGCRRPGIRGLPLRGVGRLLQAAGGAR